MHAISCIKQFQGFLRGAITLNSLSIKERFCGQGYNFYHDLRCQSDIHIHRYILSVNDEIIIEIDLPACRCNAAFNSLTMVYMDDSWIFTNVFMYNVDVYLWLL